MVLIGGPGQGKSTLSQFLCQMYRAALLAGELLPSVSREARYALAVIEDQGKSEGLSLPAVPRFPLRVELSQLAASLADGSSISLFSYLVQRIRGRTGRELSTNDLREWLGAYPWLLVLDGLDEVPASSTRLSPSHPQSPLRAACAALRKPPGA